MITEDYIDIVNYENREKNKKVNWKISIFKTI